jgi:hypothetical protein
MKNKLIYYFMLAVAASQTPCLMRNAYSEDRPHLKQKEDLPTNEIGGGVRTDHLNPSAALAPSQAVRPKRGLAFECDETGPAVMLPSLKDQGEGAAISVMAWVKPEEPTSPTRSSFTIGKPESWMLRSRNEHTYSFAFFVFTEGSPEPRVQWSYRDEAPDQWFHVVGTYDGKAEYDNLKLYINGKPVKSATKKGAVDASPHPLQVGVDPLHYSRFKGKLNEVQIFNRVLRPDEILAEYSLGDLK